MILAIVVGSIHDDTINVDREAIRNVMVMVRTEVNLSNIVRPKGPALLDVEYVWHGVMTAEANVGAVGLILSSAFPPVSKRGYWQEYG